MTERRCPAASLTADLFVEILSRLPCKSICRCRRVSRAWRDLISHPDHRTKLPRTLAGFLYSSTRGKRFPVSDLHLTNVSGTGRPFISPSFGFLPKHQRLVVLDCCNGLLLCRCWSANDDFHYFVCNPATETWVAVPDSTHIQAGKICNARLGFDPVVSPHFHVLEFSEEYQKHSFPLITRVEVYSSETRGWIHRDNGCNHDIKLVDRLPTYAFARVFLNGCLHSLTVEPAVAVVDVERKTWRKIAVPNDPPAPNLGFIQQSQGRLHYVNFQIGGDDVNPLLVVYVLEDYDSQDWILKDASCIREWFNDLELVAVHPERNLIFYTVGPNKTLKSYDMGRQQVQVIRDLGHDSGPDWRPYVPLYSELQALHRLPGVLERGELYSLHMILSRCVVHVCSKPVLLL